jgi:hypothetical protein
MRGSGGPGGARATQWLHIPDALGIRSRPHPPHIEHLDIGAEGEEDEEDENEDEEEEEEDEDDEEEEEDSWARACDRSCESTTPSDWRRSTGKASSSSCNSMTSVIGVCWHLVHRCPMVR